MENKLQMQELLIEMDTKMSERSFKYFFETVLGFHYSNHHKQWDEGLKNNRYYCVKASRDHGKSTLFMSYALWIAAFNPKTHIMIFSHSLEQTLEHMRFIRNCIDMAPCLRHLKPTGGKPWAKSYFEFTNGSRMMAKSVGGATRGFHPDVVVCDDILWGNTSSELQRAADWFYAVLLPVLHHTARLMMVGTPFSYNDLYAELEQKETFLVETYPAINDKGEALWPERWDLEALDSRRKDMPAIAFTREYLCEPMDDMSSLFPSTVLQLAKDNTLSLMDRATGDDDDQYFIGWDPAISSDRQADYTVMVVLRRPSTNPELLELVHVVRRKGMDFRTQIMEIQRLNNKFQPVVIELESNHFQRVFATELRADTDLPVKTFISTRQRRESLLMGLVMRFENEQIKLPWGDEHSRDVTSTLERELMMFGMSKKGRLESIARHDDFALALALAHWGTTEFRERIVDLDDLLGGII